MSTGLTMIKTEREVVSTEQLLMDPFSFSDDLRHQDLFWASLPEHLDLLPPVPAPFVSAFVPYVRTVAVAQPIFCLGGRNIHRRLIGFLRSTSNPTPKCSAGGESRRFRHMMWERQRREKLSQCYSDLYSMLSSRPKADKISIVQSAAMYVRELKRVENELRRRNEELKARLSSGVFGGRGERVRIHVAKSPSAIESMIGALRCLPSMGVKVTDIHSELSGQLSAVVNIKTSKASTTELETAVKVALMEVGENFPAPVMLSKDWFPNRHGENNPDCL